MTQLLINPIHRDAVAHIDAGDVAALESLIEAHPEVLADRFDYGEGYFERPWLLWFVAKNPVRNDRLPANIARIATAIVDRAKAHHVASLPAQLDYCLSLVSSSRVTRQSGSQTGLIDPLVEAGADPDGAMLPALSHQETDAVRRLLHRGAALTLPVAAALGRHDELEQMLAASTRADRQMALACAALYADTRSLQMLVASDVDLNAWCPTGFHAHVTPLHHAVQAGSLAAVQILVTAGADPDIPDRSCSSTPQGWARHFERDAISTWLGAFKRKGS